MATNLETKSLHLVADVEVSVAEQVEADVEKRRVVLKDGDGETPELKQVRKKVGWGERDQFPIRKVAGSQHDASINLSVEKLDLKVENILYS